MDEGSWDTPRGMESWVAMPNGSFALKKPPLDDVTKEQLNDDSKSDSKNEAPAAAKKNSSNEVAVADIESSGGGGDYYYNTRGNSNVSSSVYVGRHFNAYIGADSLIEGPARTYVRQ